MSDIEKLKSDLAVMKEFGMSSMGVSVSDLEALIAAYDSQAAAPAPQAVVVPPELEVLRHNVRYAIADLHTRMSRSYHAEPTKRISFMDMDAVHEHVKRLGIGGCLDGAEAVLAAGPIEPSAALASSPVAQQQNEDTARLDWLDQKGEKYGFEDYHEGNRWIIDGPFANLRKAIDACRVAAPSTASPSNMEKP